MPALYEPVPRMASLDCWSPIAKHALLLVTAMTRRGRLVDDGSGVANIRVMPYFRAAARRYAAAYRADLTAYQVATRGRRWSARSAIRGCATRR
jgi:hypothetical protein